METTHENSRLKPQFLPSATATVATDSGITLTHVKTEGVIPPSLLKIQEVDYLVTEPKIQPSDVGKSRITQPLITIQDGNCKESSQLAKINQLSFFEGFNCLDLVAVTGNNLKQELRKLLNTVQYHHTLVDVFLCLSFASCLFTGELRLALALVRLWWGGSGNKPLGANTTCRLCLAVFEPPYRPNFLGLIIKTSLPFEKV